MTEPVLYTFRRCPYAMRARMAFAVSGTRCEMREVKLREKPQAMLDASPKGTVPVLVLQDGTVIDESIDVMRWVLATNDPDGWLAGDDAEIIAANDGPFKHHLDRYKYASRHGTDAEEHRAAASQILLNLERRLEASTFLCGDRLTLTDAAIMPFIRQFAATDRAWFDRQPLPKLRDWLDRQMASELFTEIMVKRDQWRPAA
ncbi:glutathione S-transferase [Pontixanthobacter sp.]|uniref:glutathione S-transferase n=1 Tax=Pontixanthobacter sp. TaxID=2792078 RepID=UPI003C7E3329